MTALKMGDLGARTLRTASKEKYILRAYVVIGSSGAVDTASSIMDEGISISNNGTGVYDIVFPSNAAMSININVQSSAGTVIGAYITADIPPNGTATIKTVNAAGAATNPASGDALHFLFTGQPFSV